MQFTHNFRSQAERDEARQEALCSFLLARGTVRKVAKKGSRDQQIDLEGRIYEAFLDGSNG